MGFHIDLTTLNEDAAAYSKGADKTIEELESTKRAFNKIVTSNALYGSAGEAVSNDVNNNLNAILTSIKDEYLETAVGFAQDIKKFKATVGEQSDGAVLDEDTLNKLITKLDNMAKDQEDLERSGKKIFASIDDIIALSVPHSNFPTGYRTTKKQVKKIITDVHTFNSAKGALSQLGTQLHQTNSQLNQAAEFSDVGYNDSSFQDFLSDTLFAAKVAVRDAPIEKAIKEEQEAKSKAKLKAEKEQKLWEQYHPNQASWNKKRRSAGIFWNRLFNNGTLYNFDSKSVNGLLNQFVLAAAKGLVGGTIGDIGSLLAFCQDTTNEEMELLISAILLHPDKVILSDFKKMLITAGDTLVTVLEPEKSNKLVMNMATLAAGKIAHNVATKNVYALGESVGNLAALLIPVGGEAKAGITAAKGTVEAAKTASVIDKGLEVERAATETAKTAKAAEEAGKLEKGVDDTGKVALKSSGGLKDAVSIGTAIDRKVTVIKKGSLPANVVSSFRDGHYTTVITNEEITVYRSFGGRAKIDGGYATTVPATSRANTIVDSALLPEWQNTAKYEEVIRIPKGTRLNIGKVAPQLSSDGTVYLKGGADQIVLPKNWSSDWIEAARIVPRR